MELPVRREDLIQYHNDRRIVSKTADQVIRDFSRFGFEIGFPDDLEMAYDALFDQLSPVIKELMNQNTERLYSLLYSIDLSEHEIHIGLDEMPALKIYDSITHLILERELKKVLTREYFAKNS
jgi:hypothetical protein